MKNQLLFFVITLIYSLQLILCKLNTHLAQSNLSMMPPTPSVISRKSPMNSTLTHIKINTGNSTLGAHFVDQTGRSLYIYNKDRSGISSCKDACEKLFLPAIVDKNTTLTLPKEMNLRLLGKYQRPDGRDQLSYNRHPLYYFSKDTSANQTNGQGLNSSWFVISPNGEAITPPGMSFRNETSASGGSIRSFIDLNNMSSLNLSSLSPVALNSRKTPEGEDYLTSGQGISLYVFIGDKFNATSCTGLCSTKWLPFAAPNKNITLMNPNVKKGLVGLIQRDDGRKQVTYYNRPLYFNSIDKIAGDIKGQGLKEHGNYWYLVKPDGSLIIKTRQRNETSSDSHSHGHA